MAAAGKSWRESMLAAAAHETTYPDWTEDKDTGYPICKGPPEAHALWRRRALHLWKTSRIARARLYEACRESFVFWVDSFVYTPKQLVIDEHGRQRAKFGEDVFQPYITWPVHAELHAKFRACIANGSDMAVPKSRDMRATWHFLLEAIHDLVFSPKSTVLIVSRKEALVDSGDSDALFPRMREVLGRLPAGMVPHLDDKHMHLGNPSNGAQIDGAATTKDVGVGGRRTWMLFDEAARNRYLEESWNATRNTSPTRVVLSTFYGPGKFRDLVFSGMEVFPIGYWDHPDKGRGRQIRTDDSSGTYTSKPGSRFWWTPWLDQQVRDPKNPRSAIDIAQNEMMDPDVAGNVVFDVGILMRQLARAQAVPPTFTGDIVFDHPRGEQRDLALQKLDVDEVSFKPSNRGRLVLWCPLLKDALGRLRPPQNATYVLFSDPSNGHGQANTTIAIGNVDTGTVVGALADPTLEPHELARAQIALALWFGGTTRTPLIGWEANGPGMTVERHVTELEYPSVYSAGEGKGMGWWNNKDSKRAAAEDLRDAWATDQLIEYDTRCLTEAGDYIVAAGGRVTPARLREDRDAEASHGDRVIARMGLLILMREHPKTTRKEREPVHGTLDYYVSKVRAQSNGSDDEEDD